MIKERRLKKLLIAIILIISVSLPLIMGTTVTDISTVDRSTKGEDNLSFTHKVREMLIWSIANFEDIANVLLGQFYPKKNEFTLGTPTIANIVKERLSIFSNPRYWSNYFHEALIEGVFIIPMPVDLIKPELFLPTSPVKAAVNISPLPREYVNLDNFTYNWKGREKSIDDFMLTTETDSVVIVHHGKLVYESYANGWSPDMHHQIWSATKAITSAMVGIAWGEGLINSVHDPIEEYITSLEGTEWEGSTIENLLQMESGLYWNEEIPLLAFNSQVQQWMSMFLDFFTRGLMGTTRNEYFMTMKRINEPGSHFMYNSADTQVLAWLVETLYDKSFAEAVSEKIWNPGGMEVDAEILTDRVGDAIASQSFFAIPYDLARFGELFRNNGKNSYGMQVIPEEWIEMSTKFSQNSNENYGYKWWNGSIDFLIYEASGFQGNKISVAPEVNMTAVRMSHHLGGDLRPNGDNPAKISTYGFDIVMGESEWQTMITAIAHKLEAND